MRCIEGIEETTLITHTGARKLCVEAPSGVEPLHRSFAARPTTRRPLTIQCDRLRRQRSEIKRFDHFYRDHLLLR